MKKNLKLIIYNLPRLLAGLKSKKVFFVGMVFLLLIAILAFTRLVVPAVQDQQLESGLANVKTLRPDEAEKDKIVQEVGKLIDLPANEEVFMGTVSDEKKLEARAPFLKKAYKGNILLVYPAMTIIYDTKTNAIIDISSEDLLHRDKSAEQYKKENE